jgi:hypothetical protein
MSRSAVCTRCMWGIRSSVALIGHSAGSNGEAASLRFNPQRQSVELPVSTYVFASLAPSWCIGGDEQQGRGGPS